MKKLCVIIILALLLVIGAMGWFFVVRGTTEQGADGRTVILLKPSDRDFLLAEMRGWLESVQGISAALAENDMKEAAQIARKAGNADLDHVPASLLRSIPLEFKQLGLGTHEAFATLAKSIEEGADAKQALKMLSGIMLNCTGCHAGYRVDPKAP